MKKAFAILVALYAPSVFSQNVTLPDYGRIELDNGTVIIVAEKDDVPLVSAEIMIRGGAASDPKGKEGLASLYASLLEKGSGELTAAEFAETVDSVGGSISSSAGKEAITISANFLAEDQELMISLIADMLMEPTLDEGEMVKLRDRSINFIKAAKDTNLNALVGIYADAFIFGDHPYGNPVSGSEASLETITKEDIERFYEEQVGADRLIVSVSGDFERKKMTKTLIKAFGTWRRAGNGLSEISEPNPIKGRQLLIVDKPGATQTYFAIGNTGVSWSFDGPAELELANTVFGGRFTSMLNTELRVKSGLTYGAGSRLFRGSQPGSVSIRSYTATETTVEAIDMAVSVLGQLRDEGIPEDMVSSAQNYVMGQFPTDLETASQLASRLAFNAFYGLGDESVNEYGDEIMNADVESIAAVISQVYPSLDNLVFVLLGDAEKIREEVGKYGISEVGTSITEVSILDPTFRH